MKTLIVTRKIELSISLYKTVLGLLKVSVDDNDVSRLYKTNKSMILNKF